MLGIQLPGPSFVYIIVTQDESCPTSIFPNDTPFGFALILVVPRPGSRKLHFCPEVSLSNALPSSMYPLLPSIIRLLFSVVPRPSIACSVFSFAPVGASRIGAQSRRPNDPRAGRAPRSFGAKVPCLYAIRDLNAGGPTTITKAPAKGKRRSTRELHAKAGATRALDARAALLPENQWSLTDSGVAMSIVFSSLAVFSPALLAKPSARPMIGSNRMLNGSTQPLGS